MVVAVLLNNEPTNDFKDRDSTAENTCEIVHCITKTALTYRCDLEGADYKIHEDDTIVSKCVGAV
jgi:hypothetical protein